MSFSRFFKQLPYTVTRSLGRPPFSLPLTLLSTLTFTNSPPITTQSTSTSPFANISIPPSSSSSSSSSHIDPSTPSYLSVRIRCHKHALDIFSEALLSFGASSTSVDEDEDNGCEDSDETYIESIFPEGEDVDECIVNAATSVGLKEIPHYEVKMGEQYDWIRKTQESFHPVEVTEGLWIVPEWKTPPDVQATNIILNPGLAFGTGEHPTTKLCLLLLCSLIKGGESFLDYGTGSGILGIAAIKFGAALSVGFDVDPQAIASARRNAALNNIGPEKMKLHLVCNRTCPSSMTKRTDEAVEDQSSYQIGDVSEVEKYDVVISNILLNPLLELAEDIISYAKPGAVVGISGILSEQLPPIIDRYSEFLEGISVLEIDDWACVSGTKKPHLTDN